MRGFCEARDGETDEAAALYREDLTEGESAVVVSRLRGVHAEVAARNACYDGLQDVAEAELLNARATAPRDFAYLRRNGSRLLVASGSGRCWQAALRSFDPPTGR
jgi:hypothetical protein